jgi:8-oxo-dGTP pyrophosphatase MutT (NUDIX family)
MTPERNELFKELIREIINEDGGFIGKLSTGGADQESWELVQKLVSWGAVELLITRNGGQEVLLRHRTDDPWNGWHVIGGYVRPKESIQAFANRAVSEEKAGMTAVTNFRQIGISKWLDHPRTYPLCSVLVCDLVGDTVVKEREDLRWFSLDELPLGKMLHTKHELYLEAYVDFVRNHPQQYCLILGE